jgi:hypothetical protein
METSGKGIAISTAKSNVDLRQEMHLSTNQSLGPEAALVLP